MAKTSKTSDKRSKKSGEISEEKLDKVAGGAIVYPTTDARLYETSLKAPPVVTTKPILKLP